MIESWTERLFGWLFWVKRHCLNIEPSSRNRERKKNKKKKKKKTISSIDEMRKLFQQPLPAPTASIVGPCPTIILIRRRTGFES